MADRVGAWMEAVREHEEILAALSARNVKRVRSLLASRVA